jgi:hypothetical protein
MDSPLTPVITRRTQVRRMASSGIADQAISILLGVRLNTIQLFFPRELAIGALIASLRFPIKVQAKPPSNKSTYPYEPIPPGSLVICGPNGQEISN